MIPTFNFILEIFSCDVYGIKKRKSCQKCRLDACLQVGMNPDMIKVKRQSKRPYDQSSYRQSLLGNRVERPAGALSRSQSSVIERGISDIVLTHIPFDPAGGYNK